MSFNFGAPQTNSFNFSSSAQTTAPNTAVTSGFSFNSNLSAPANAPKVNSTPSTSETKSNAGKKSGNDYEIKMIEYKKLNTNQKQQYIDIANQLFDKVDVKNSLDPISVFIKRKVALEPTLGSVSKRYNELKIPNAKSIALAEGVSKSLQQHFQNDIDNANGWIVYFSPPKDQSQPVKDSSNPTQVPNPAPVTTTQPSTVTNVTFATPQIKTSKSDDPIPKPSLPVQTTAQISPEKPTPAPKPSTDSKPLLESKSLSTPKPSSESKSTSSTDATPAELKVPPTIIEQTKNIINTYNTALQDGVSFAQQMAEQVVNFDRRVTKATHSLLQFKTDELIPKQIYLNAVEKRLEKAKEQQQQWEEDIRKLEKDVEELRIPSQKNANRRELDELANTVASEFLSLEKDVKELQQSLENKTQFKNETTEIAQILGNYNTILQSIEQDLNSMIE